LTDAELAHAFDIEESTLNLWKNAHPEFMESIINGKEKADAEVAEKLWHRALGYSHPEEKIFVDKGEVIRADTTKHYPPDTAAAFIWLKNRRGQQWRDKQEIDVTSNGPLQVTFVRPEPE
jgi:hypothetical protein